MKTTLVFIFSFTVLGLFLGPSVSIAGDFSTVVPGSGIRGTAHDLRIGQPAGEIYGANDDSDRVCVWCHAPHHALKPDKLAGDIDYLPLWNHETTTMTYDVYSNGADEPADTSHASTVERIATQPGSASRLCLSCHDGSVAVNEYGFFPGDTASSGVRKGDAPAFIRSEYKIGEGGNMTNQHPIGFEYDAVAVDDEMAKASMYVTGEYTIGDLLRQGRMECTTCHDVHNTSNRGEKFLWVSDRDSALCLICHLKG